MTGGNCWTKNHAVFSDNKIIHNAICDNTELLVANVSNDYKNFIDSIRKLDLLIIDKHIPADLLPLYRVNNLINLTETTITKNEIKLTKPLKLGELLDIIDLARQDEHLFCCLNSDWIYHQRAATLISERRKIALTAKENTLLSALLLAPGFTLDKEFLKNEIWHYHQDSESSTVETHFYKLKQKLPKGFLSISGSKCSLHVLVN